MIVSNSILVLLIAFLSSNISVSGNEEYKKCSDFFQFITNDLVLIKNIDFIEKIKVENITLDILYERRFRKGTSFLELIECKENHPNDSTRCKYKTSIPRNTKIVKAYNEDNDLICGKAVGEINRGKRSTEEITCGDSSFLPDVSSLITGGTDFKPGSWPWMAALYNNLQFICGGSIVSEKVIVTAAHCIQDKFDTEPIHPEESSFVVGKHNLKSKHEKGFKIMSISKFVTHPSWKPHRQNYDADVGVAILQNPVTYKHNIKPICLHAPRADSTDTVGLNGVVAGWGYTEEKNLNTGEPRIVEIPIVNEDACVESDSLLGYIMTHRTFCTAGNLGKGPCKGDSGSGLAVKRDDKWYLRGIVSATLSKSCDGESHVVFSDVAQFNTWILGFIVETTPTTPAPTTTKTTTTTTTTTTTPSPPSPEPEQKQHSWPEARDQAIDVIQEKTKAETKRLENKVKKWFG